MLIYNFKLSKIFSQGWGCSSAVGWLATRFNSQHLIQINKGSSTKKKNLSISPFHLVFYSALPKKDQVVSTHGF